MTSGMTGRRLQAHRKEAKHDAHAPSSFRYRISRLGLGTGWGASHLLQLGCCQELQIAHHAPAFLLLPLYRATSTASGDCTCLKRRRVNRKQIPLSLLLLAALLGNCLQRSKAGHRSERGPSRCFIQAQGNGIAVDRVEARHDIREALALHQVGWRLFP